MQPLRVCFAIDNLSRAGTESQLLALIQHLDRSQVEPSLVLLDGEGDESRSLEPANCQITRLGVRKLFHPKAAQAVWRLRKIWHETRPDILQAYFLDSSYFTVPIARCCGISTIVRVRNNLGYWLTRKHRILNRIIRPMVTVSLTNSESGKQALIDADRLPEWRIRVIENGVDLDRFATLPEPLLRSEIVVGCVANLRAVKNIDGLMRAAKVVCERYPHVRFRVAGDGEQRAELHELHGSLRLGDRFELTGATSDVPGFLGCVDVAVLPSHSEGMSNALIEYMAAGRAIIATDVGANAVVLGGTGTVIPARSDDALSAAICDMLTNPEPARVLAKMARHRVESGYSRTAMVRRFEAFHREISRSSRVAFSG